MRENAQLAHQARDPVEAATALGDELAELLQRRHPRAGLALPGAFEPVFDDLEIGQQEGQRVVDLVGDAGREQPDARHLLHLDELLLGLADPHQGGFDLAAFGQESGILLLELSRPLAHAGLDLGGEPPGFGGEARVFPHEVDVLHGPLQG